MKIEALVLEQKHLIDLVPKLQDRQFQQGVTMAADRNFTMVMRAAGPCAVFKTEGEVIGCAGLIDFPGTNRCVIWALFAANIRPHFRMLTRKMIALLNFYPRRRYEAYIDPHWPEAKRLVQMLGFQYEGLMKAFEADGADRELWGLVKKTIPLPHLSPLPPGEG